MRRLLLWIAVAAVAAFAPLSVRAEEPVRYRFTFPEPAQQWMQVEATFSGLPLVPLELRMSRSSPGRYGAHDFGRNVYDAHAYSADGIELRIDPREGGAWSIPAHTGTVTVKYKVYGNRLDGTYLAVDTSHAHINMPAALIWARGLDHRSATLTFEPPTGAEWEIATQLYPGSASNEFTAPNLQYLIDSPVELGPLMIESFRLGSQTFRFAAHHTGTRMELQSLLEDVAEIVAAQGEIFGEFPPFETGTYTFMADLLPHAAGDAMEHRNSTVITSPGSIANARQEVLDSVSHEFFHVWNVERIRPQSLEPFNLERPNESGELWLAEGFTQYYGPLAMRRADLLKSVDMAQTFTRMLNAVSLRAGRLVRSAEEVSRTAVAETPQGTPPSGVVSYYQLGAAIALALDLSVRERSNGAVSLDDFMRRMWNSYGKPGGSWPGYVDRPYTVADVEATLSAVSGDRAFAREFLARHVQGRELADYARLLALAGFIVRPAAAGRVEVVLLESTGASLTAAQRAFRESWLGSD